MKDAETPAELPSFAHKPAKKYDSIMSRFLKEHGWHDPDYIEVRATGADRGKSPSWDTLDDMILDVVEKAGRKPHSVLNDEWHIVPMICLTAITSRFDQAGAVRRLEVRDLLPISAR
jgi:hypothetical protein